MNIEPEQQVLNIDIKDLILWTENPRDPVDLNATDQYIVDRALADKSLKWNLPKLAKEMGKYFDQSELPTVVYDGAKPIVYDGNRRVIIGKIKMGAVTVKGMDPKQLPSFPQEIPCNVCVKRVGLNNVYRKHIDSGSWQPLERDVFLHNHMGEPKSVFLVLEEDTGIITTNPHLNQRFVKDEILNEDNLKLMGFHVDKGHIHSVHSNQEGHSILTDISEKIYNKQISTRKNRGQVINVLEPGSQQLIDINKSKNPHLSKIKFDKKDDDNGQRQSKRTVKKEHEIFGGKLYLKMGTVGDLYRDITDLYEFYLQRKDTLSQSFAGLIRMSLRLLCETAAKDKNKKLEDYVKAHFADAKKTLGQDTKTTLSVQNVSDGSILQLLQIGAHNYQAATNLDQTIAVSIAVGALITLTHGREEEK
ncbi:MAG: hypothetical protein JWQ34_2905 [Mucilaginibacter sp.]|uniref:hypothetical protein n=1 Tax=Mucilaginibacter sp. TaxID=1882438 RepID=UPI00260ECB68|nr:hypothetical protein [Mucilaginibacter sp.]MDB5004680.1 hypothetical protein [Mucilaginibacter sp.]